MRALKAKTVWMVAAMAIGASAPSLFADPINLMTDSVIRATGTYTYYARGDASENPVTPFTVKFYPGGDATSWGLHGNLGLGPTGRDGTLTDTGSNGAPISFATGELTDSAANLGAVSVAGWIDTLNPSLIPGDGSVQGRFDILFDLGQVCNLADVKVNAWDVGGFRFLAYGGGGYPQVQDAYVAQTLANPSQPADSDFTLFGTSVFPVNTEGWATFTGSATQARYVDLRIWASVSITPFDTASMGGSLEEVQINGSVIPIPEPTVYGLLGIGGVLVLLRRRSRK